VTGKTFLTLYPTGEGGESANWVVLIYESIKSGAIEQATRRFASRGTLTQKFLMWCIPSAVRERRRRHLTNSTMKTNRRMAQKTDHRDFIYYILKQREKKNEVSDEEVLMNAALFMYANSDCRGNTANKKSVSLAPRRLQRCFPA